MMNLIYRVIGTHRGNRAVKQMKAEFAARDTNRAEKQQAYRAALAAIPHDLPHRETKRRMAMARARVYGR